MPDDDRLLMALADSWLAGWDAAKMSKPESVCPFPDMSQGNLNARTMWHRGWAAGCRMEPRDLRAKRRFLDLSLGLTREIPQEEASDAAT